MAYDMSNTELTSIRIEMAENGYTVECSYKMKQPAKNESYDYSHQHEEFVFKTAKETAAFINKKLS